MNDRNFKKQPGSRREPVVKPEHMPMEHRAYLNYNEKEFADWANNVGPNTSAVVKHFLTSGKEPEQGYKYCASLTKLSDRYGPVRLENACQRLLAFSSAPSIVNSGHAATLARTFSHSVTGK